MASAVPALIQPLEGALALDLATVEAGLPLSRLQEFLAASGLKPADLHDIVIPARTLKHRRARKEALSTDESDKLARLVRVFDHAVRVFGTRDQARHWLTRLARRFHGRAPLSLVRTEIGARMVEEMLGQIEEGMFA